MANVEAHFLAEPGAETVVAWPSPWHRRGHSLEQLKHNWLADVQRSRHGVLWVAQLAGKQGEPVGLDLPRLAGRGRGCARLTESGEPGSSVSGESCRKSSRGLKLARKLHCVPYEEVAWKIAMQPAVPSFGW